jgi:hypothetical protein
MPGDSSPSAALKSSTATSSSQSSRVSRLSGRCRAAGRRDHRGEGLAERFDAVLQPATIGLIIGGNEDTDCHAMASGSARLPCNLAVWADRCL